MADTSKGDKVKMTELTTINLQLKDQIKLLLTKLSTFFPSSNETTNNSSITLSNSTDNNKDSALISDLPFSQQLSIYQNSIELAKGKIKLCNPIQISSYENQIKADEEMLYNLKSDYDIQLNQCNRNQRLLNSFSMLSKFKKDINAKKTQLKELKEEINIIKLSYKHTETKIKAQDKELIALNDSCLLIRENIEHYLYNGTNDTNDIINQIDKLTEKNHSYQKDIEIERKEYVKEINRQETLIQELHCEVDYMALKLNQVKQKERITYMKDKMQNNYRRLTQDKSTPLLMLTDDNKHKRRSITPNIKERLNKSYIKVKDESVLHRSAIKSRNSYVNTTGNPNTIVVFKQFDSNYDIYKNSYSKVKHKRNFSFLNNYSKG